MFTVDDDGMSCVVKCHACGWRQLTATSPGRVKGWRAAQAHERLMHAGQVFASRRLHDATRRAAPEG